MRTVKLNFTIPQDVAAQLKASVGERGRSAFVARAIRERLRELEEERLNAELVEGYKARLEEDSELNDEWEQATVQSWPRQ